MYHVCYYCSIPDARLATLDSTALTVSWTKVPLTEPNGSRDVIKVSVVFVFPCYLKCVHVCISLCVAALLAVVVIACVLGGVLLIMLLALLAYCCW